MIGPMAAAKRTSSLRDLLRLDPDVPVDLERVDARSTPGLPSGKAVRKDPKGWSRQELDTVGTELATYQEQLYASAKSGASRQRLLLVLQAMDCGGKDGTIKRVASAMNPQGMRIVAFGRPTTQERAHPFLWRIRQALPEPGYVGVFNRSHYEDVLIVRVHNLVPRRTWARRYDQINRFEQQLVDDGFTLVKVFLHISYREQGERLRKRLVDPTKYWKYDPADVDERARWDDYQAAYAEALGRCSAEHAPWYVVPADRKWYRNWAVAQLLRETFADLDLAYPPPVFDLERESARLAGLADGEPAK